MRQKCISIVLVLCLFLTLALPVRAAGKEEIQLYAQSMIQYYRFYQEGAQDAIDALAEQMATVDPEQAAMWANIMEDWSWVNARMPVGQDVLPDGLPQDDSLCIVVLGYGLNDDGSMKEELVDRLVVALSSAIKYPNALIAVTGGQTSETKGVTEAGQMSSWLQKKGISKDRILVEKQSLSTTANAINVYKLLNASYPQVDSIAVVTSDYHIAWGCTMFTTVSNYKSATQGGRQIELLAAAACDTKTTYDTMDLEAAGICTITGLTFHQSASAPAYFESVKIETPEVDAEGAAVQETQGWNPFPELVREPETEQTQTQEEEDYTGQIIVSVLLVAIIVFVIPKKPRKRRKRPEWNWDV